ncbi:hypothetical protein ONS95_004097 [Cadophora gregata]|uniref:uncharacterized protein n=1 Tax=Cadophora gregata TaxID=51156 RepID=UPI0026DBF151|nr:uncharacterized protein ONS95_004097 [Cadophora gregata]KAK0105545.1 hypothetical protein ONS96_004929 [Cadophora gregata f. sp. sojae]KAK0105564.1 hypothetical protein ONS95_004097 [Cadophora gregata]
MDSVLVGGEDEDDEEEEQQEEEDIKYQEIMKEVEEGEKAKEKRIEWNRFLIDPLASFATQNKYLDFLKDAVV